MILLHTAISLLIAVTLALSSVPADGHIDAIREPVLALNPTASRLVSLSVTDLDAKECAFLADWVDAFEFLPLENLVAVHMHSGVLDLSFDFDGREYRDVKIKGSKRMLLRLRKGHHDLVHGRTKRASTDGRTIRFKKSVRVFYDRDRGITGVHQGDLSLYAWLKRRPVQFSTYATTRRLAIEGKGSLVLCTDRAGRVIRRKGEVVPQSFERWIRVECSDHVTEHGLGEALDGRDLVD